MRIIGRREPIALPVLVQVWHQVGKYPFFRSSAAYSSTTVRTVHHQAAVARLSRQGWRDISAKPECIIRAGGNLRSPDREPIEIMVQPTDRQPAGRRGLAERFDKRPISEFPQPGRNKQGQAQGRSPSAPRRRSRSGPGLRHKAPGNTRSRNRSVPPEGQLRQQAQLQAHSMDGDRPRPAAVGLPLQILIKFHLIPLVAANSATPARSRNSGGQSRQPDPKLSSGEIFPPGPNMSHTPAAIRRLPPEIAGIPHPIGFRVQMVGRKMLPEKTEYLECGLGHGRYSILPVPAGRPGGPGISDCRPAPGSCRFPENPRSPRYRDRAGSASNGRRGIGIAGIRSENRRTHAGGEIEDSMPCSAPQARISRRSEKSPIPQFRRERTACR